MKNLEEKLNIFIKWLENPEFYRDYSDGTLESAIKSAQEEVCRKVADTLRDVLALSDEEVKEILEEPEIVEVDENEK